MKQAVPISSPSAEGLAEIMRLSARGSQRVCRQLYDGKAGRISQERVDRATLRPNGSTLLFPARVIALWCGMILPGWAFAIPLISIAGLLAVSFRQLERSYPIGHLSLVRGKGTKQELDVDSAVTIGRDERNTSAFSRTVRSTTPCRCGT
jgi:hypothetical protein